MIRVVALLVAVSIPNAAAVASCDAKSRKAATIQFHKDVEHITGRCGSQKANTNFTDFPNCIVPFFPVPQIPTVLMLSRPPYHLLLVPKVPARVKAPTGIESSDYILQEDPDNFWQQAVKALDFVPPDHNHGAPISIEINSRPQRTIDYLHAHIDFVGHDWPAIKEFVDHNDSELSNWVPAGPILKGHPDADTYQIRRFDGSTSNVIKAALCSVQTPSPGQTASKNTAGQCPAEATSAAETSLLAFQYHGAFYILRTVYKSSRVGGHAEDLQKHDDQQ
jgi:CDP-diacylglycerol pyrophosphatase